MDGHHLLSLKEYISKPRKCPLLVAWKDKETLNLRLHRSWPSLHLLQNHYKHGGNTSEDIAPSQIDRDPFSYYLSPASESTSDGSPVGTSPILASKSEPELLGSNAHVAAPPRSHFLPHHSPTSSPASKERRRKQREEADRKAQSAQLALTPEIVEIKPKIPHIIIWPPQETIVEEIEDSLSPLPEPFVAHSPTDRGRPKPRVGSKSRSRKTPPRCWGPRHMRLPSIPEERDGQEQNPRNMVIGLGIA